MPHVPNEEQLLRAAVRELHAARLYGFALLVALGERQAAADATAEALAAAGRQARTLRHPERAAAWLRGRVARALDGSTRGVAGGGAAAVAALRALGVDDAAAAALAQLSVRQRAALVASTIERFAEPDVEMILEATPAAARGMVATARRRYLAAVGTGDTPPPGTGSGPLAERVLAVAARGFAPATPRSGGAA